MLHNKTACRVERTYKDVSHSISVQLRTISSAGIRKAEMLIAHARVAFADACPKDSPSPTS